MYVGCIDTMFRKHVECVWSLEWQLPKHKNHENKRKTLNRYFTFRVLWLSCTQWTHYCIKCNDLLIINCYVVGLWLMVPYLRIAMCKQHRLPTFLIRMVVSYVTTVTSYKCRVNSLKVLLFYAVLQFCLYKVMVPYVFVINWLPFSCFRGFDALAFCIS